MTAELIQFNTDPKRFWLPTPEFKLFWAAYPFRLTDRGALVKTGKAKCLTFEERRPHKIRHYFADAMAVCDIETLCEAAEMYGKTTEPRFIRDAHRWLRDGDFDTEYAEMVGGKYDGV